MAAAVRPCSLSWRHRPQIDARYAVPPRCVSLWAISTLDQAGLQSLPLLLPLRLPREPHGHLVKSLLERRIIGCSVHRCHLVGGRRVGVHATLQAP